VRPEAQYLEFSMAASVQGWRTKWFYIKDRKSSPEHEFGLPPFDASQEVKKLKSWDLLPSDSEAEQILPLLSRIQTLKTGLGGALSGIQLMAFFIQRRVQPLQHRLTNLWTYSGLEDSTRISEDLMSKEDVDKRVRNLTKLTKVHSVADLTADFFDFEHPLPEVYFSASIFCQSFLGFDLHYSLIFYFVYLDYMQDHQFLVSRPPLPEAGPLPADLASPVSEAPEADESQDEDDVDESEEETSSSTSPPPAFAEDVVVDKKRKRVDEIASSSSAAAGKASVEVEDPEYFDMLAS
jgi:hypothetical protein